MPDPEKREMKAMFHAEERFVLFEKGSGQARSWIDTHEQSRKI